MSTPHTYFLQFIRAFFHRPRKLVTKSDTIEPDEESVLNSCSSPHPSCLFCGVSKERGFSVVWENEVFAVFTDIDPASEHHLQLVPKHHIGKLSPLRDMVEIAHNILDGLAVPPHLRRIGFHIPPYISVPHLHMHIQALPYRSIFRKLKYPVVAGWSGREKGVSWFVDAEQAVRILEKGSQVRILPC
ncbi:HIT-like protein [Epithele typhae]|uniref:HIT-like protein n=1 Tax=Epithele typhae TaxID=378194 RepID=UPI00200764AE|nr:HIT-like protein [Epithele typhae]KAH9945407.1 HIT-like protein [Epithele typhae]